MKVFIPFGQWSKDKLTKGIKTATSRSKVYGKPGDTFSLHLPDRPSGQRIVYYKIVAIIRKTLI